MEDELGKIRKSRNGKRLFTLEQKAKLVEMWEKSGESAAEFARRHEILAGQLYKWRKDFHEGGRVGIRSQGEVYPYQEVAALKKRIADLERVLGRKTAELEIFKAAEELGYIKKKPKP
jgi:transposase